MIKPVDPWSLVYYMRMLPSKVMPYLYRLAAPLMDSSVVHTGTIEFYYLQLYDLTIKSDVVYRFWSTTFESQNLSIQFNTNPLPLTSWKTPFNVAPFSFFST